MFQFGLIFLIFYFLIIRPQQRQRKQHDEALRHLKRGDRIVTTGGIIGEAIHIKEKLNLANARQVARFAVQWIDQKAI